jgi:hypothetical protein
VASRPPIDNQRTERPTISCMSRNSGASRIPRTTTRSQEDEKSELKLLTVGAVEMNTPKPEEE